MIEIGKALLLAVKGASSTYKIHHEEEKWVRSNAKNQKAVTASDMTKLKDQCDSIESDSMEKDVGELEQAESKRSGLIFLKGKALKRKCDESKDGKLLEEHYSALAEKKKRL